MNGDTWDVIIGGAGPAGSLVARQLARRGLKVLLADKAEFPREKVCGTCLNRNALAALDRAGLGDLVDSLGGVPLTGFDLRGWQRTATLTLPAGRSLSRPVFDTALVDAAVREGVTFRPRTRVTLRGMIADHREVTLTPADQSRGETVQAKIVIDATGLGGMACAAFTERISESARIGVGSTSDDAAGFAPNTIHMAVAEGGYVGTVVQEDGRLNLAAAFDAAFLREQHGPAGAVIAVLTRSGFPVPSDLDAIEWTGTPKLTRRVTPIAADRVFRLGDAAGYVEPFTGEGMAWALSGAVALAPIVADACDQWNPNQARGWADAHRRIVSHRQALCRMLAAILKRPRLARTLLSAVRSFPAIARPFVQHLNAVPRRSRENTA